MLADGHNALGHEDCPRLNRGSGTDTASVANDDSALLAIREPHSFVKRFEFTRKRLMQKKRRRPDVHIAPDDRIRDLRARVNLRTPTHDRAIHDRRSSDRYIRLDERGAEHLAR